MSDPERKMTPDELRAIMEFLQDRVRLGEHVGGEPVAITFPLPTLDEMAAAGLHRNGCRQILGAEWWEEMVDDVLETPDMSDPEDPPEQVLRYARDVVSEYLRKRVRL